MKAILATTLMFLAMLALTDFVAAQSGDAKAFYYQCIDHKIVQCEAKASKADSASAQVSRAAQLAEIQAAFYKAHRETLADEMVRQDLTPKTHCVEHFLNKAYSIGTTMADLGT